MSLGAESAIYPPSLGKAYLLFISVYFNLAPASLRPERARRSGSPASGRIVFTKIRKVERRSKRMFDCAETVSKAKPKIAKVERRSKRMFDYAETKLSN